MMTSLGGSGALRGRRRKEASGSRRRHPWFLPVCGLPVQESAGKERQSFVLRKQWSSRRRRLMYARSRLSGVR
ncbi:unnamed protein product [Urochloa humidicola]